MGIRENKATLACIAQSMVGDSAMLHLNLSESKAEPYRLFLSLLNLFIESFGSNVTIWIHSTCRIVTKLFILSE